jgi:class 3 adenylate cyclase
VRRFDTAEDLKDLGVSIVGHRRTLLDAISVLRDANTKLPPSAPLASPPPRAATAEPVRQVAGERRHVTVMFCDLVDSTGIAAQLDDEEWRDLVSAYLDAASTAVSKTAMPADRLHGDFGKGQIRNAETLSRCTP